MRIAQLCAHDAGGPRRVALSSSRSTAEHSARATVSGSMAGAASPAGYAATPCGCDGRGSTVGLPTTARGASPRVDGDSLSWDGIDRYDAAAAGFPSGRREATGRGAVTPSEPPRRAGVRLRGRRFLTLVAVYFICMTPLAITDFWWQAKAGELIVKQGRVPTRDPFSWTAQGQPWLVHEWLPDVFFYLAYSNGLQWLLLFYKSGMAALACGLVIARTWTRTRSIPLGIAAALATASVMRNFTDIRPQMVTFVLLAALLLALDEYRVGRLARLPWMLPVLFALWANLHGGVVVGLLIVLIWAAGEAVGKWLFGQDSHGLVPLSVSLAAACVAVGLNPNGFHVYTYPLQVLGHPAVTDYIREWFSPDFTVPICARSRHAA